MNAVELKDTPRYRLLLAGKLEGAVVNIKAMLLEQKLYDVELVSTPQQVVETVKDRTFDLGIFNLENLHRDNMVIPQKLRALGHTFPLLLLVKTVRLDDFSNIDDIKATNILQIPFKERDFIWLCREMADGEHVHQRLHPRFYVKYRADIIIEKNDIIIKAILGNYSKGGAYLEFNGGPELAPNDPVKVKFQFKNSEGEKVYEAKTIWTRTRPKGLYRREMGIQFTSTFP
jgi:hypothetical protein